MVPNPFIWLLLEVLDIYLFVVIAAVVVSWLIAFNVINTHNQFVNSVVRFLYAVTEPVFRRIRSVVPLVGGIDLSPLILVLGLIFLQRLVIYLYTSVVI